MIHPIKKELQVSKSSMFLRLNKKELSVESNAVSVEEALILLIEISKNKRKLSMKLTKRYSRLERDEEKNLENH